MLPNDGSYKFYVIEHDREKWIKHVEDGGEEPFDYSDRWVDTGLSILSSSQWLHMRKRERKTWNVFDRWLNGNWRKYQLFALDSIADAELVAAYLAAHCPQHRFRVVEVRVQQARKVQSVHGVSCKRAKTTGRPTAHRSKGERHAS
jgi:hypothetical protein